MSNRDKENIDSVKKFGNMEAKYKNIIEFIMLDEVLELKKISLIEIEISHKYNKKEFTSFKLTESQGLSILYRSSHLADKVSEISWNFNHNSDQNYMIRSIDRGLQIHKLMLSGLSKEDAIATYRKYKT